MKKFLCVGVLLILVISLAACEEKEPISVFDADKEISAVTISTAINGLGEIQVPQEALEEIAQWLKAFTVGEETGDTLIPGTGSTQVTVTYADGTSEESSISTVAVDGKRYYIDAPKAPESWLSLFEQEEPPKEPNATIEKPDQPIDAVGENVIEFPLLLNVGKESDIDLDGDGTVERVLVEIISDEFGWNRYGLSINGVDQTDVLELYSENPDTDWYAIVDLNTGDPLLEIALPYEGPSSDPSTTFLRYEGGTLSSLGEVYGMVSEDHLTFNGVGGVSSFMRLSVLQTWYAPVQWSIGADGVFEDIPQDLYYPFTDPYVSTKTALKELAGYADKGLDSSRSCVEIGTKMEFLATDDICWVQCKAENGTEFWLHLDEEFGFQVELFDGSYAWDGIEGLSMAD